MASEMLKFSACSGGLKHAQAHLEVPREQLCLKLSKSLPWQILEGNYPEDKCRPIANAHYKSRR